MQHYKEQGTQELTLEAMIYLNKAGITQFIVAKEDYGVGTPEGNYAIFIDANDNLNFRFLQWRSRKETNRDSV